MAAIHIFLNSDEIRQAVQEYLANRGVEAFAGDIYFCDLHSTAQLTLQAEIMNAKLSDDFKGFDK